MSKHGVIDFGNFSARLGGQNNNARIFTPPQDEFDIGEAVQRHVQDLSRLDRMIFETFHPYGDLAFTFIPSPTHGLRVDEIYDLYPPGELVREGDVAFHTYSPKPVKVLRPRQKFSTLQQLLDSKEFDEETVETHMRPWSAFKHDEDDENDGEAWEEAIRAHLGTLNYDGSANAENEVLLETWTAQMAFKRAEEKVNEEMERISKITDVQEQTKAYQELLSAADKRADEHEQRMGSHRDDLADEAPDHMNVEEEYVEEDMGTEDEVPAMNTSVGRVLASARNARVVGVPNDIPIPLGSTRLQYYDYLPFDIGPKGQIVGHPMAWLIHMVLTGLNVTRQELLNLDQNGEPISFEDEPYTYKVKLTDAYLVGKRSDDENGVSYNGRYKPGDVLKFQCFRDWLLFRIEMTDPEVWPNDKPRQVQWPETKAALLKIVNVVADCEVEELHESIHETIRTQLVQMDDEAREKLNYSALHEMFAAEQPAVSWLEEELERLTVLRDNGTDISLPIKEVELTIGGQKLVRKVSAVGALGMELMSQVKNVRMLPRYGEKQELKFTIIRYLWDTYRRFSDSNPRHVVLYGLDINRASEKELRTIPFLNREMVQHLLRRRIVKPYDTLKELTLETARWQNFVRDVQVKEYGTYQWRQELKTVVRSPFLPQYAIQALTCTHPDTVLNNIRAMLRDKKIGKLQAWRKQLWNMPAELELTSLDYSALQAALKQFSA